MVPGRDKTAAIAVSGAAIIDSMAWPDANTQGSCFSGSAGITWLFDLNGRIAIKGTADVKAALGLAEALMIAIGEGAPVPYEYRAAPPPVHGAMGYGHSRAITGSGCPHGGRSASGSGVRIGSREDMPAIRLAGRFRRVAW